MSAPNQGRQSPPPEEQSGAQQQDAPSSGQGVNDSSNNQNESKSQIDVRRPFFLVQWVLFWCLNKRADILIKGLSSNPKGPLDDHVAETTKKTVTNVAGDIKDA